jgi:hypothetical protein
MEEYKTRGQCMGGASSFTFFRKKKHSYHQIEDDMGRACSMKAQMRNAYRSSRENLNGKDHILHSREIWWSMGTHGRSPVS